MDCPKRCPKTTRCNKKIKKCESNRVAPCKRTAKLNTLTHHCDPRVNKVNRCYPGTKRNPKTGYCENSFIKLCKAYIMDPKLDLVLQTSWLSHKDCNIFTIGEVHGVHTKCSSILDMFTSMIEMNNSLSKPIKFDIMIEHTQQYSDELKPYKDIEIYNKPTYAQMTQVRYFLNQCLHNRNCNIRVHWADPTHTSKRLPEWLEELAEIGLNSSSNEWVKRPKISDELEMISDVSKLLTENPIVVKEIQKASKINPKFNLAFATQHFMNTLYKDIQDTNIPWIFWVNTHLRYVMDFYTVARIIKLNMKNVIFYAGNSHTNNVIDILSALDFKLIRTMNGTCPPQN